MFQGPLRRANLSRMQLHQNKRRKQCQREKERLQLYQKVERREMLPKKEEKSSVPSHLTVAANPPRLSELAVALKKQGLVEVDNPFVAGHCYFEAVSLSNQLTNFMTSRQGAPLIRSIFSSAYNRDVIQKGLCRHMDENSHRKRLPSHDDRTARTTDDAERSAGRNISR